MQMELEIEKRPSHYKVPCAQFVLKPSCGLHQIHAKCTLAAISLARSFLGMLISVIIYELVIVYKLAPPGLQLGPCGAYLKSIAYRCGG